MKTLNTTLVILSLAAIYAFTVACEKTRVYDVNQQERIHQGAINP